MRMQRDRFATAVNYVASFGSGPLTLTPHEGDVVRFSINVDGAYAEYLAEAEEPLESRFSVQSKVIRDVARVCDSDTVEVALHSTAKVVSNGQSGQAEFCIQYMKCDDVRPTFEPESEMNWGKELRDHLLMVAPSTGENIRSHHDCAYIDIKAARQTVVATNGRVMTMHDRKDRNAGFTLSKLLVERRWLSQVVDTISGVADVKISVGLNLYSITCGKRTAIIQQRQGLYPRWDRAVERAKGRVRLSVIEGNRKKIVSAAHRACFERNVVKLSAKDGVLLVESIGETKAVLKVPVSNDGEEFGPIHVEVDDFASVAAKWPSDSMQMAFYGEENHLVITSPGQRNLLGVVSPVLVKG